MLEIDSKKKAFLMIMPFNMLIYRFMNRFGIIPKEKEPLIGNNAPTTANSFNFGQEFGKRTYDLK